MTNKPLTIGLLWHSISSDNLGVGALTLSQMALITQAAARQQRAVQFVVVGTRGSTPYPIRDFNILQTAEFALRAFKQMDFSAISSLRRCDVVFDIGEGDSFADIYGLKRLSIQVLSKWLAQSSHRPLILSPQTIGPFKSALGQSLGKLGLGLARNVFTRDHLSTQYVNELGFGGRTHEVIDVAFALPYTPAAKAPGTTRVGINVSGLMMNTGAQFGLKLDYAALIKQACTYFLQQPGTEVYLVPHVISDAIEVEDDLRASQKLAQEIPGLKLAPRFKTPSEAKSFISGLDFFTGARMHACIAAYSSGVPVVPMAYSRKFNGLFNSLGYTHVLDCLACTTQTGFEILSQGWLNRQALSQEVATGNALAQHKLNSYVDTIATLLPA